MAEMKSVTLAELEAGLDEIRPSPTDEGVLVLMVRRPQMDTREVLAAGELDRAEGLVGDNWSTRGSSRSADGSAHPDMQLNIMNTRVIALVVQEKDRWPLAGDQLFIDLDDGLGLQLPRRWAQRCGRLVRGGVTGCAASG